MLGNRFKGSLRCTLRQTTLSAGIRARFDRLPSVIATFSGLRQACIGVGAHGQHLFLASPLVPEPPPFRPVRLHKQAQSASIGELVGSIAGSRVANGDVSQAFNTGWTRGIAVGNGFYPLPNGAGVERGVSA
jgi:hypothetical protein